LIIEGEKNRKKKERERKKKANILYNKQCRINFGYYYVLSFLSRSHISQTEIKK
jgi:hypothetical protein